MTRDQIQAWLEARVRQDDETGCLLWTMAVNPQGHPIASVDGVRSRAVRPWIYRNLHEKPGAWLGERRIMPSCTNLRCMNREHWLLLSFSQINERLSRLGRYNTPKRLAAQMRNGSKNSPYSDADVARARALRASGLTLEKVAQQTGMHLSTVSRVCRGERRALLPGVSIFGCPPSA